MEVAMKQWLTATAADLGRGIEQGSINPVALTETYLSAIAAHPLKDRIYARVTADRARAEAKAAAGRAMAGRRLSPLDGVPISWKDLFDTAGCATEAGTALLKGRIPTHDAEVLRNATAMGLVCLGKTHLSELAFSGLGVNPVTATPPCVNDAEAAPGGSSSGAATSVAFGLAAAAIGSDTGGSVRVPSAWNDLVGLKTTAGRLSNQGVVPLAARFDTAGPMTRSVEDAALLLAALQRQKPVDLRACDLSNARFAILNTIALDDLDSTIAGAFGAAVESLRAAGAQIVPLEVPILADAIALSGILFSSEAYGTWKDTIEANPHLMYDEILHRFRSGAGHAAADYVAAWQQLDCARGVWADRTAGYDAVLVPSTANTPPKLVRLATEEAYYKNANLLTLRNTRIGNLMGLPALTVPTSVPSCGLMLMGKPLAEEHLLSLGAAVEVALG
jgi:aspartyl-tRNA(Asn)/glutamyl-tRNA(Gln) amidotransferase subunit A